jgi:RNA recognition motif-containing protein
VTKRLYVGGLDFSVDDAGLEALFTPHGKVVVASVIYSQSDGYSSKRRSKGYGFVEMSTPKEAQTAIENLHGSVHLGRKIHVAIAKPRDRDRGSNGGGMNGRGGGRRFNNNKNNHYQQHQYQSEE